jgi:zinc transporter ZupT
MPVDSIDSRAFLFIDLLRVFLSVNNNVSAFGIRLIGALFQAISAGTLLYMTVCEILPRERAKWHHHSEHTAAGILQFASLAAGFCVMYAVNSYISKALSEG